MALIAPTHLPRRGGVPAERGAGAADRHAARADRGAEGVRLHAAGVGWHYLKFVLVIAAVGVGRRASLGVVLGPR